MGSHAVCAAFLVAILCTVAAPGAQATVVAVSVAPESCPSGQTRFLAYISGLNNVLPASTIPLPTPSLVSGLATLCIDEANQKGQWTLNLCQFTAITGGYVASHLHVGAAYVDSPPPLVPLEPPVKPADPAAPPTLLPKLSPPLVFTGCRKSQGTFTAADFVPLPPSVLLLGLSTVEAVTTFPQFVSKLKAGEIYANVHSVRLAAGEARGNFQQQ